MVCLLVLTQISLSAQSYKLPDYTTFKPTPYVFLMEQHDVPVISVSASYLQAPLMIKTNLDLLTATALKHGTKNFTKAKLDEDLDFIGANVALMLRRILRTFLSLCN
jgi:hypothetical protein